MHMNLIWLGMLILGMTLHHFPRIAQRRIILPAMGLLAFFLWGNFLHSGIHPTLAGLLIALAVPMQTPTTPYKQAISEHLEKWLHPWVSYLIMPVFALANAGIHFSEVSFTSPQSLMPYLGIVLGLLIGKPLGITLFCWLGSKLHLTTLPRNLIS